MKTIDILIVVDVIGALAGNLQDNVYLIDTNKYAGSGAEGQAELKTACGDGQLVRWHITAINSGNDVNITGFTGQIINEKVCVPTEQGMTGDKYWEGRVETQGTAGRYQYSVLVTADGKQMTFDPYLEVS
ncbi:hypothetical protein CSA56_05385 [candidate division KSB3 bacterium]|uniref:Uncharacterized protein n=1 Tax=candidate division KSB3 bacterium TaxID=2044937 RepID=A0A2G6KHK8_9BACT|nr:MAG: hypothetical protein CSA56_05385 [candidate division KSB3 bacterium]